MLRHVMLQFRQPVTRGEGFASRAPALFAEGCSNRPEAASCRLAAAAAAKRQQGLQLLPRQPEDFLFPADRAKRCLLMMSAEAFRWPPKMFSFPFFRQAAVHTARCTQHKGQQVSPRVSRQQHHVSQIPYRQSFRVVTL